MVFRDVHTCLAKKRSDSADYTWNVVVGENQQRITGLDIYMKGTDSRETRRCARLRSSGNGDFLHATAQPYFDRVRIVLDRGLRRREIYPATFGDCAGVDKIEPFLFNGTFQQATRSGSQ
jgi:hypothetical protein